MSIVTPPPRLRPDIVLGPALRSGESVVHYVKDQRTGWFYRIGPRERFIMSRLDGRRTLHEIAAEYATRFDREITPQHWGQILASLDKRQLLTSASAEALSELSAAHRTVRRRGRWLLLRRMPLFHPDALCTALAGRLRVLFTWWFVVPALAVVVALGAFVLSHVRQLSADQQGAGAAWVAVPLVVVGSWLVIAVHEIAHGVACKHYGGEVREIGLMWLLIPYCKTDDVLLIGSRRARVATAFAGIFAHMLVLLPVLIWWWLSAGHPLSRGVAAGVLLSGGLTAIANLMPFLRLDGYHMLTHTLGVADLTVEARRYWRRVLTAWSTAGRGGLRVYRPADHWVYAGYGVATAAVLAGGYTALFLVWLTYLERWFGTAPAVVLLIGETAAILAIRTLVHRRRTTPRPKELG
jgi:putative peptide zinc metalloprotease protein